MEAFEILTKLSLKELDEKCKSLGLKTYGDKKTRAKRILDHQKAETDRLVAEAEKIASIKMTKSANFLILTTDLTV